MKTTYLGDGAYAEQDEADPTMIWIWCDRAEGRHRVAIEPEALRALVSFAGEVWPGVSVIEGKAR